MRRLMGVMVMVLLAAGLLAAPGAAQELERLAQATPQQRAAIQTAFMTKKLNLTAEQMPKVEAINLKYAEEMQPVLTGSDGPLRKMEALKRIEAAKETALGGVLTATQMQTLKASREELKEHMLKKLGG